MLKKYCWNLRNLGFALAMLELLFPGEIGQTSRTTSVIMMALGFPAALLNYNPPKFSP